MLQIHYFCCRNSLCKVLEKAAVWPEVCLAVLTRSHGLGLCSVPAHGHLGPASLGPWPALAGLPGSGWVPGGTGCRKPLPRCPGRAGAELWGGDALPGKAPERSWRDTQSQP